MRLNLVSLFFVAVSFMSVTLAWFAYSGLAKVSTEIGVKAWYIELEKNGEAVTNDIVISLPEVYPGMDAVNEIVNIKNLGDSDAEVKYSIVSARILGNNEDDYVIDEIATSSEYVEDVISHNYPFHIDINLTKRYALAKIGESSFEVSVSWPLDSDTDALDSLWGKEAYNFEKSELALVAEDVTYQIRPAIQIVISVTAEQYLGDDTVSDPQFNLGDSIMLDVINNTSCTTVSPTCIQTYVIDENNTLGDTTVTLLPDLNNNFPSGTYSNYSTLFSTITNDWVVSIRPLLVEDLLKIVSTDVSDSFLIRENISNTIIGNLSYGTRMNTEIAKAVSYGGHYKFVNAKFSYFNANACYWTSSEYNGSSGFAVKKIDDNNSKIYGEAKTSSCNVVPVIMVSKSNL